MADPTPRQRLPELSVCNVILCFLVMFIHVSGEPVTVLEPGSWQRFTVMLPWRFSSFVVPAFLFLSGLKAFLPSDKPFSYKSYYIRRFRLIWEPYAFATLLYYFVYAAMPYYSYPVSVKQLLLYLLTGDVAAPFYYVILLVQFTLLLPLWRYLLKKCRPALLLGASFIVTVFFSVTVQFLPAVTQHIPLTYNDRFFPGYLLFWIAGCLCGKHYEAAKAFVLRKKAWFLGAYLVMFLADPVLYCLVQAGVFSVGIEALCYLHVLYWIASVGAMFTLAALYASKRDAEKPLPRPVSALDRVSYPIYLWHCLILSVLNVYMLPIPSVAVRYAIRIAVVMVGVPLLCLALRAVRTWADRAARRT